MGVIAAQLGHRDTRMAEKHYAHLAPSYVARYRTEVWELELGSAPLSYGRHITFTGRSERRKMRPNAP
jgi:hypothetical protein